MGEVYEAYDDAESERIALKALSRDLLVRPDLIRRFAREVRAAKNVTHPNVCKVFHLSDDKTFYTMEFLEGVTLARHLHETGPLSADRALRLLLPIAAGLDEIHRVGITHRDFKPENVMIVGDPPAPKIMDFGLARFTGARKPSESPISMPGQWLGTLAYMAPEQVRREEATMASDIWALGVLIFLATTGVHPFRKTTEAETVDAILGKAPLPDELKTLPLEWQQTLHQCLQQDPTKRPTRAAEVLDLLLRTKPIAIAVPPAFINDLQPASGPAQELEMLLRSVERFSADRRAADAISALRALVVVADNVQRVVGPAARDMGQALEHLRITLSLVDPAPSDTQIEWLYSDAMSLCEAATLLARSTPGHHDLLQGAASAAEMVAVAFARWRQWLEATYDPILSPVVDRRHTRIPHPTDSRPRLYVVSGPSAAGKDRIIGDVIPRLLSKGIRADCITKYSTRDLRPMEQPTTVTIPGRLEYQRQLDPVEFEKWVRDERLIMSYTKYGNKYAFGADTVGPSGDPVRFCIFSEFTRLDAATSAFERAGVAAIPILILARPDELERRMFSRGLHVDDARRRIAEMRADVQYIMANKSRMRMAYPLVTWNEHPATLEDAVAKVLHFVIQTMPEASANA